MLPPSEQEARAERSGPLAVCTTPAAADFVAATLDVHGIRAETVWGVDQIPSLGWVRGYRVTVRVEDEQAARELLAGLSRDDVLAVEPGGEE